MTCRQWVDKGHIECEAWADQTSQQCTSWRDEGSNQCSSWADEGSNQCSSWADEGHNECCDWAPCSWFCDAFYWVANWVCQAWYWVAKWVCVAWYWVANWVCQAFVWVTKAVCLLWSWVAMLVCVAWDNIGCWISAIFGGNTRKKSPIQHVFVLMLENRAFDHMLGFSGISGTDAVTGEPRAIDGVLGGSIFNIDHTNNPTVQVAPSTEADFKLNRPPDDDPGHEFLDTLVALCGLSASYNGGAYPSIDNSGFIDEYATMKNRDSSKTVVGDPAKIMKCYSPRRLRILTQLANEFVVCDRWFSSLPGPTWPNRFFMHAASSGGLDDSPSGAQSFGAIVADGYRFENGTIFDRLDDACIDWTIFAGDSFPVSLAISGMTLNLLQGRIRGFDEFSEHVNDPELDAGYIFIEPNYGNDLPPSAEDFTCGDSQHPLDDITRGERLIKTVYETIRNSPHWNDSVLLITYDEHGGFFDHVQPPSAVAPGDQISDEDNNHHNFTFDQLGVRVPAVVVSPLIPRNLVDHTVYDHTSLLATVEQLFGLKPLTRRDAAANNFLHLFTLNTPRTDAPTTLDDPAVSGFTCDDDPSSYQPSTNASGLTLDSTVWDNEPLEGEMLGFLQVAARRAYAVARGRDRQAIIQAAQKIRTTGQARRFMADIAYQIRQARPSPSGRVRRKPRDEAEAKAHLGVD